MSESNYLKQGSFDYFVKGLDFWRRDILDRLDKIEQKPNLTETAGECTCHYDVDNPIGTERSRITDKNCPIHGQRAAAQAIVKGIIAEAEADLPLNARVAKAVGKKVVPTYVDNCGWRLQIGDNTWCPIPDYSTDRDAAMGAGLKYMEIINKNRPVSTLEFRMGIDIYGDLSGTVRITQPDSLSPDNKSRYELVIHFGKHGKECCEANGMLWAETLPQATCEAICKHAEQQ